MFKRSTVFVVGAGASHELKFPTGAQLANDVATMLNIRFQRGSELKSGSRDIATALSINSKNGRNEYVQAARQLAIGLPLVNSIDALLDKHKDDDRVVLCGKLGIVAAIAEAERNSSLYIHPDAPSDQPLGVLSLQSTWLIPFFKLLNDGVGKQNLHHLFHNVSFIIFNYDRCLEYFLVRAIRAVYQVSDEESQQLVSQLKIYHPYGKIGELPWHGSGNAVPFGGLENDPGGILTASKNIRTYTERVQEEDMLLQIHDAMATVEQIIFLGFGFLRENMQLLTPPIGIKPISNHVRVVATAMGISDSDKWVIANQISGLFQAIERGVDTPIVRNDCKAATLFSEYWHTLGKT